LLDLLSGVRITIGREQVELARDTAGTWRAQSLRDGRLTELTQDEVNQLLGIQNAPGAVLDLAGVAVESDGPVHAAISRARSLYDDDQLAVLLDTSTVRNAMQPLTGGPSVRCSCSISHSSCRLSHATT
jgi:hypothetical protein